MEPMVFERWAFCRACGPCREEGRALPGHSGCDTALEAAQIFGNVEWFEGRDEQGKAATGWLVRQSRR